MLVKNFLKESGCYLLFFNPDKVRILYWSKVTVISLLKKRETGSPSWKKHTSGTNTSTPLLTILLVGKSNPLRTLSRCVSGYFLTYLILEASILVSSSSRIDCYLDRMGETCFGGICCTWGNHIENHGGCSHWSVFGLVKAEGNFSFEGRATFYYF